MSGDGVIIHLFGTPPAVEGAPEVEWRGTGCYPHAPLVDRALRSVSCRRCKANLDPIEVLLEVAHRHEEWNRLTSEVRTMRATVEALKAEEQRVKARTKSHARKDADEAVAAERAKLERQRAEIACRVDDARRALDRIDQLIGRRQPQRGRRRG